MLAITSALTIGHCTFHECSLREVSGIIGWPWHKACLTTVTGCQ